MNKNSKNVQSVLIYDKKKLKLIVRFLQENGCFLFENCTVKKRKIVRFVRYFCKNVRFYVRVFSKKLIYIYIYIYTYRYNI